MGLIQKLTVPTLMLIWSFIYMLGLRDNAPEDLLLIKPVFYLLIIIYITNFITDIKTWRKEKININIQKQKKIFIFIGLVAAYLILLSYLGFIIDSILFFWGNLKLFQVNSIKIYLLFPPIMTIALYGVFKIFFNVPLPIGFLGI